MNILGANLDAFALVPIIQAIADMETRGSIPSITKLLRVQKRRIPIPKNTVNSTIWIVVIIKDNVFISIQVELIN